MSMTQKHYEEFARLLVRADRVWQAYYGSDSGMRIQPIAGVSRQVGEGELAVSDVLTWLKEEMRVIFKIDSSRCQSEKWIEAATVRLLRCAECASVLTPANECPVCEMGGFQKELAEAELKTWEDNRG